MGHGTQDRGKPGVCLSRIRSCRPSKHRIIEPAQGVPSAGEKTSGKTRDRPIIPVVVECFPQRIIRDREPVVRKRWLMMFHGLKVPQGGVRSWVGSVGGVLVEGGNVVRQIPVQVFRVRFLPGAFPDPQHIPDKVLQEEVACPGASHNTRVIGEEGVRVERVQQGEGHPASLVDVLGELLVWFRPIVPAIGGGGVSDTAGQHPPGLGVFENSWGLSRLVGGYAGWGVGVRPQQDKPRLQGWGYVVVDAVG